MSVFVDTFSNSTPSTLKKFKTLTFHLTLPHFLPFYFNKTTKSICCNLYEMEHLVAIFMRGLHIETWSAWMFCKAFHIWFPENWPNREQSWWDGLLSKISYECSWKIFSLIFLWNSKNLVKEEIGTNTEDLIFVLNGTLGLQRIFNIWFMKDGLSSEVDCKIVRF